MNRQIRRDQKRKEEKQEKEKEKRRAERRKQKEQARANRQRRRASESDAGSSAAGDAAPKRSGGRVPGRFSGALAAATVFFIILQAVVPTEDATVFNTLVSAGFYLLFGYFFTLWLLRRETSRAVAFSLVMGAVLGLGVEVGKFLQPELTFDPLLAIMILPALVIGTLLGRLVFYNAPA